jgi:hypothetical protein
MGTGVAVVAVWVGSILAGALAASAKRGTAFGAFAGVFLGPLGAIAALGIDDRPFCPRCGGRLDAEASICQHCHVELWWQHGCPSLESPDEQATRVTVRRTRRPPTAEQPPEPKTTGGWG